MASDKKQQNWIAAPSKNITTHCERSHSTFFLTSIFFFCSNVKIPPKCSVLNIGSINAGFRSTTAVGSTQTKKNSDKITINMK